MNNQVSGPSKSVEESARSESSGGDRELVQKAASGDAQAFGDLFERHREKLYFRAFRYLRNRDDSLDVVQEAFLKAWSSLASYRAEASFSTWMGRIVTNLCIDRIRRPKTVRSGLDEELVGVPETEERAGRPNPGRERSPVRAAELAEFAPALQLALGELSEKHRSVFLLHAEGGLKYREIAEELGISMGTVMSRLFYAREKLQELLASHLEGK